MRAFNAFLMAMALAIPVAAPAFAEEPRIVVTGEGRVDARPDMATLTLGVTSEGATAAEAMTGNTLQLAAILERLRATGIADRDLQTTGLSLNPVWDHSSSAGPPRITGYLATNMLTVRVRALDTLGSVLDAAIRDGANTFNGLGFGLTDPAPALDEARRRAVADAVSKAGLLVQAAGLGLGPVVSITEGGTQGGPDPMFRMQAEMASAPVPVAQGEISLTASVTMVFRLIPAQ